MSFRNQTDTGWWLSPTPLKNMSSSVGMMTFSTEWKVIKTMFPTNRDISNSSGPMFPSSAEARSQDSPHCTERFLKLHEAGPARISESLRSNRRIDFNRLV